MFDELDFWLNQATSKFFLLTSFRYCGDYGLPCCALPLSLREERGFAAHSVPELGSKGGPI